MARHSRFLSAAAVFSLVALTGVAGARQLASRPAPDWIARLERRDRIAGLEIDYIITSRTARPI